MDCTDASIPSTFAAPQARLCVLGSGSRGNCSVLHTVGPDDTSSVTLIDLGFSPRMTARMLAEAGLSLDAVDAVLLTHLDHDHCHLGWNDPDALPRSAQVFLHEGHLQRAYSRGLNGGRLQPFHGQRGKPGDAFSTSDRRHLAVRPLMTFHDDLGAAVFHIKIGNTADAPAIGYATDLGRVTDELISHLKTDLVGGADSGGVDVLVIESNYCPRLQVASDRPEFLKRRIMGGRGHLSNDEAIDAIEAIAPREHVVLVHLSQQCNDPALVASLHRRRRGIEASSEHVLTISTQDAPTRWVPVRRRPTSTPELVVRPLQRAGRQLSLFG